MPTYYNWVKLRELNLTLRKRDTDKTLNVTKVRSVYANNIFAKQICNQGRLGSGFT